MWGLQALFLFVSRGKSELSLDVKMMCFQLLVFALDTVIYLVFFIFFNSIYLFYISDT